MEIRLIIFGLGVLGFIPASIAQKKVYNQFLRWLYGACSFPIALPVALLIEEGPENLKNRKDLRSYVNNTFY